MKKLISLLAIVLCGACATVAPVQMHYSINFADHGPILCRDYTISGDTVFLWDAGHFVDRRFQTNVTDSKAIGFKELLIVKIK